MRQRETQSHAPPFESTSAIGTRRASFVTRRERQLFMGTASRHAIRSIRICIATCPCTVLDWRLAHTPAKQLAKSVAVGQPNASCYFVRGQRRLREQLARTLEPDSLQILGW